MTAWETHAILNPALLGQKRITITSGRVKVVEAWSAWTTAALELGHQTCVTQMQRFLGLLTDALHASNPKKV